MIFDSFSAFIEMGGYGLYVWSAYTITLVVFTYNIVRPILMRRELIKVQKRILLQEKTPLSEEPQASVKEQPEAIHKGATS